MKKLLCILVMAAPTITVTYTPPFNYYVGYPETAKLDKINKVKVWIFKDKGDYTTMMDKITFAKDFKKGFGQGYGAVNKYTVAYLPKAGAAIEAASGETLAGLGTASEIAANIHTLIGQAFKPGLKLAVKELKKKYKDVRIGYDGKLKSGEYFWKKADDKDRYKVYLVVTLGDDTRKELEGPAKKIDMYPLWQGYVQIPQGTNSLYMNVIPRKFMITNKEGEQEPIYSAQVVQTTEEEFNKANLKLSDKD